MLLYARSVLPSGDSSRCHLVTFFHSSNVTVQCPDTHTHTHSPDRLLYLVSKTGRSVLLTVSSPDAERFSFTTALLHTLLFRVEFVGCVVKVYSHRILVPCGAYGYAYGCWRRRAARHRNATQRMASGVNEPLRWIDVCTPRRWPTANFLSITAACI